MLNTYYIVLHSPIYWRNTESKLDLASFDTLPQARRHATAYSRSTRLPCFIFKFVARVHPVPQFPARRVKVDIIRGEEQTDDPPTLSGHKQRREFGRRRQNATTPLRPKV